VVGGEKEVGKRARVGKGWRGGGKGWGKGMGKRWGEGVGMGWGRRRGRGRWAGGIRAREGGWGGSGGGKGRKSYNHPVKLSSFPTFSLPFSPHPYTSSLIPPLTLNSLLLLL
jgi:hypothetical protein